MSLRQRCGKLKKGSALTVSSTKGLRQPPTYKKIPHKISYHGDNYVDDYYWLRDGKGDTDVLRCLKAENACAHDFFASKAPGLQRRLFKQMRKRWKEDDITTPWLDRNYWYYTRTVLNAEYPLFCRRPYSAEKGVNVDFLSEVAALWREDSTATLPAYDDETIYLDLNLLQQELHLPSLDFGDIEVSPTEDHLAVMIDCSQGKEIYTLFIFKIENVNYLHWLREHSSAVESEWASHLLSSGASPYTPVTPVSLHSTPSCRSPKSYGSGFSKSSNRPAPPSPTGLSPPQHRNLCASTRRPTPKHVILHRIDLFDMSAEVQWVGASSLLYFGIDEKMRPYQLIYHDLLKPLADATLICFQEEDEAFWLGSLCFTADDAFWTMSSASSDVTEVYVCRTIPLTIPHISGASIVEDEKRLPFQRVLAGAPVVSDKLPLPFTSLSSNGEISVAAPICFSRRQEEQLVEYDVEHHPHLLGRDRGAWIITSNANGCTNFSLFYVTDEEAAVPSAAAAFSPGGACTSPGKWHPLFEYDESWCIEAVECFADALLITARHGVSSTVLFCPLVTHLWPLCTSEPDGTADGSIRLSAALSFSKLINLATVTPPLVAVEKEELTAVDNRAPDEAPNEAHPVLEWDIHCLDAVEGSPVKGKDVAAPPENHHMDPELPIPEMPPIASSCCPLTEPLPTSVELYCSTYTFNSRQWCIMASHLLVPSVLIECEWSPEDPHHIRTRVLRRGAVVGMTTADLQKYSGTVLWVPSNYAFVTEPCITPLPVKEKTPDTIIPVFLCWREDTYQRGKNPMLLEVYATYGENTDVGFSTERLTLLDHGVAWGAAGVRGGGDCGIHWRNAGRKLQRATTMNDFVSVSRYVQDARFCATGRLVSSGSSAGGTVVFSAANMAPHLYHSITSAVPFVDALTSLLDESLPLTVTEWDEFGNPVGDREAYDFIKAWSPVNTLPIPLPPCGYPNVFVETAWSDTRVGYWESLKLIAMLRERCQLRQQSGDTPTPIESTPGSCTHPRNTFLHYCDFGSGHGGSTGRYQQLAEMVRVCAYVLTILGQS